MKTILMFGCLALTVLAQVKRPVEEFATPDGVVKITIVRHASLMIEAGGQVIHVDPAQGNYDGLPQADLVLYTDSHPDHLVPALLARLRKPATVILAPEVVARTISGADVMRSGESKAVGKWKFEALPMYNLKRGPAEGRLYHDKGRGIGYVVTWGGKRFYIAGDTENIPEMRALKNIDVAFVPMNLPYTMPPEEAAEAVRAFRPKIVYPYHYRGSDLSVFEKALAGSGVEVRLRDWYY